MLAVVYDPVLSCFPQSLHAPASRCLQDLALTRLPAPLVLSCLVVTLHGRTQASRGVTCYTHMDLGASPLVRAQYCHCYEVGFKALSLAEDRRRCPHYINYMSLQSVGGLVALHLERR